MFARTCVQGNIHARLPAAPPPHATTSTPPQGKANLNPNVLRAQYAVRGEIVSKAKEVAQELEEEGGSHKYPFDSVVYCNIGGWRGVG